MAVGGTRPSLPLPPIPKPVGMGTYPPPIPSPPTPPIPHQRWGERAKWMGIRDGMGNWKGWAMGNGWDGCSLPVPIPIPSKMGWDRGRSWQEEAASTTSIFYFFKPEPIPSKMGWDRHGQKKKTREGTASTLLLPRSLLTKRQRDFFTPPPPPIQSPPHPYPPPHPWTYALRPVGPSHHSPPPSLMGCDGMGSHARTLRPIPSHQ